MAAERGAHSRAWAHFVTSFLRWPFSFQPFERLRTDALFERRERLVPVRLAPRVQRPTHLRRQTERPIGGEFERAQAELVRLGEASAPVLAGLLALSDGVVAALSARTLERIGRPALD